MPFMMITGTYISFCLVSEGGGRDAESLCCLLSIQLTGLPLPVYLVETRRQGLWRPTKPDTSGFGCGDPFRLTLADIASFIFCHKREHLQYDVAEKRSHKIFASPGIQKGHIDHTDINAFFLRQDAPLFQYLCIIPAQAVDTLDIQQIVPFQFP